MQSIAVTLTMSLWHIVVVVFLSFDRFITPMGGILFFFFARFIYIFCFATTCTALQFSFLFFNALIARIVSPDLFLRFDRKNSDSFVHCPQSSWGMDEKYKESGEKMRKIIKQFVVLVVFIDKEICFGWVRLVENYRNFVTRKRKTNLQIARPFFCSLWFFILLIFFIIRTNSEWS